MACWRSCAGATTRRPCSPTRWPTPPAGWRCSTATVYRSEIQFRLRCLRILADESTEDLGAADPCRGEIRDRSRQHVNVGRHLVLALMGSVVVVVRDVVGERGEQVALSVAEDPVEAFAV